MRGPRTDGAWARALEPLRRQARIEHGISEEAAARAGAATIRRLSGSADPGTERGRRRIGSYFWGVVRRRALAGEAGFGRYRADCLVATLAADLAEAGHARDRVVEAIVAAFGQDAAPVAERAALRCAGAGCGEPF
ncbi:MAG TPA: hypothetical protein VF902_01280 [Coriobacteriia bacterium]